MSSSSSEGPMLHAYYLDGQGGAESASWAEVRHGGVRDRPLWIHLDRLHDETRPWLEERETIAPWAVEALMAEDSRPRMVFADHTLVLILRGVNWNPEEDPEDMISLRLWIQENRLVSMQTRPLRSVKEMRHEIDQKRGAISVPDLVVRLVDRLIEFIEIKIEELEERLDDLEVNLDTMETEVVRGSISEIRREAMNYRRHLLPQREALRLLLRSGVSFLQGEAAGELRESEERLARALDDLSVMRDRTHVAHDQLSTRMTDEVNKRLYVLSLITAIFLPLNLLAAVLGANVGGIPGANADYAFWAFCGFLLALTLGEYFVLKRSGWL